MAPATRHEGDLVDVWVTDHHHVEKAFTDYERGGLSERQRRELVDHLIIELVRHSVAEEQYLYPAAREVLSGGAKLADEELAEHAEAEQVMKRLEGADTQNPEFDQPLRKLISDIRHHVEEEERELCPELQPSCSPEQLMDLGSKIIMVKQSAPTRPHPSAPDRPPANMILDPGVGMVDRLRDALSGRGQY